MPVERIPIDPEARRDEWLALRRRDVTASDVGAVCGCSPYKTAMRVWAEKAGEIEDEDETPAMRRGRWLEPAVLKACRDEAGWLSITEPHVYLRDPAARLGATPDAIGTDSEGSFIVQAKVISPPVFARDWGDEPPLHYQLQTLTEAMLWGAPRAFLAVLVSDGFAADLHTFPVARHAGAEAKIREAVAKFWAEVDAGVAPSVDYSRDGEVLRALFPPRDDAPAADFSRDNRMSTLLNDRASMKAAIAKLTDGVEEIDAEIVHKLNGATKATCAGWRITHSMTNRKAYTVPEKSYPVLRVTETKGAPK